MDQFPSSVLINALTRQQNQASEDEMRARIIVGILVVVWLVIGVAAAVQRGYFAGQPASCAAVGTVVLTIVAGPLNYTGLNPKIACDIPQPSQ
jgi:Na+/H+ antiporter NhaD/arsenite permease-like protein